MVHWRVDVFGAPKSFSKKNSLSSLDIGRWSTVQVWVYFWAQFCSLHYLILFMKKVSQSLDFWSFTLSHEVKLGCSFSSLFWIILTSIYFTSTEVLKLTFLATEQTKKPGSTWDGVTFRDQFGNNWGFNITFYYKRNSFYF